MCLISENKITLLVSLFCLNDYVAKIQLVHELETLEQEAPLLKNGRRKGKEKKKALYALALEHLGRVCVCLCGDQQQYHHSGCTLSLLG